MGNYLGKSFCVATKIKHNSTRYYELILSSVYIIINVNIVKFILKTNRDECCDIRVYPGVHS